MAGRSYQLAQANRAMHRDKVTAKLKRILKTIESARMPLRVREVYVFGSYARGALQCADLDIIIITDRPTAEDDRRCPYRTFMSFPDFPKAFRAILKSAPSERMDILLGYERLANTFKDRTIPKGEPILVWARGESNWRDRILSITPIPEAGRAERRVYIFEGEGFAWEKEDVWLWVEKGVRNGAIRLKQVPASPEGKRDWPEIRRRRRAGLLGEKLADLCNIAFDYMVTQGKEPYGHGCWGRPWLPSSADGSIRFYLGKPQVGRVVGWLHNPQVEQACALAHLRKTKANHIWVFRRGRTFKRYCERGELRPV